MHRDVKPGNLLVSDADVVKLADFGIARAADQSSITQVGSVLGTAAYLAPEQARGEEAGPRADIYSLGVVTYQLLSGRLPYEANSLSELALKQQREAPMPLDALNPSVPRELGQAVAMALAIDQEARPPDAALLAETLRNGTQGVVAASARPRRPPTSARRRDPRDPSARRGTAAATRRLRRRASSPAASRRREPSPGAASRRGRCGRASRRRLPRGPAGPQPHAASARRPAPTTARPRRAPRCSRC